MLTGAFPDQNPLKLFDMAGTSKEGMEQISHLEEGVHGTQAVPSFVKVEGGVLLDAGAKNEHHLKVAKDGHVRNPPSSPISIPSVHLAVR